MRGASDAMLMFSAAILVVVALWHAYWVAGGTIGLARALPERDGAPLFVPGKIATGAVTCGLAAIAALFAAAASGTSLPWLSPTIVAGLLGLAGLGFTLRSVGDLKHVGFFNRGGSTPFAVADRKIYSPLCLFLGVVGISAASLRLL